MSNYNFYYVFLMSKTNHIKLSRLWKFRYEWFLKEKKNDETNTKRCSSIYLTFAINTVW